MHGSFRKLPNVNIVQRVIVNVKRHKDQEHILYRNRNLLDVTNFDVNLQDSQYEKVHTKYCKFVLNVCKYVSITKPHSVRYETVSVLMI